MFAVIADWDSDARVTRSNSTKSEDEAKRLVDRLRGLPPSEDRRQEMEAMAADRTISDGMRHWASKEAVALPSDKVAPKTYYAVLTSPDPRCDDCLHLAAMWDADEDNKTVSFNLDRHLAKVKEGHMRRLRSRRNDLLKASDDHSRVDIWENKSSEDKTAWTAYRQALRDLPADSDTIAWANADAADLDDITWPTEPA